MIDKRLQIQPERWWTSLLNWWQDGCRHEWLGLGEYGEDGRRCMKCEQEWETKFDHNSGECVIYEVLLVKN